jgi:N-acyl-phosphatidylethanolamine-hydrolysing phospholipase D
MSWVGPYEHETDRDRCSPSQYVGPARTMDPPCTVAQLPLIHVCCISHDHCERYCDCLSVHQADRIDIDDHLDYYTIMDLWKYHTSTIHFFVPLGESLLSQRTNLTNMSGLKAWFTSSGIPASRVTAQDWWHESIISFPSVSSPTSPYSSPLREETLHYPPHDESIPSTYIDPSSSLTLKVAFTPAQHRSGRGLLDHMTTLWGSWCVGVVEDVDKVTAATQGMEGWTGFKIFFGG